MRRLEDSDDVSKEPDTASVKLTPIELLTRNREAMGEEQYQLAVAALKREPSRQRMISPRWEGALWMFGIVAILFGIYGALYLGGDVKPSTMESGQPPSKQTFVGPDEAQWEDKLTQNPNDIEALNTLCWFELQRRNNVAKAIEYNDRANAVDAKHPDTRFQSSLLLFMKKMPELANKSLDDLIKDHPNHADALEFRGLFYTQNGQYVEGRALVVRAEQATTDGKTRMRLRRFIQQIDQRMTAAQENTKVIVSATVNVDAKHLLNIGPASVIFVSLRDPAGGPPVAAKKLPVGPFPLTFEVTGADRIGMGGQRPIPATFNLAVRVDGDGNAMTKEPKMPEVVLLGLETGTTALDLVLELPSPQ